MQSKGSWPTVDSDTTSYPELSNQKSLSESLPNMAASTATQSMPNPWPIQKLPSRFDQLVRAKLAAEQRIPSSSPGPAPGVFDAAMSKIQNGDTVANRSFAGQFYNEPVAKPTSPNPLNMVNSPQPSPIASPLPPSPTFEANNSQLGSEQLAASFRSMVAQRINNMYATAQAQRIEPPQLQLQIPETPVVQITPTSPVLSSPYQQAPPSPYSLAPSPTVLQGPVAQGPSTPVYKYAYSDSRSEVKAESDWNGYQQPPPFMYNITPPQNNENVVIPSAPPSLHSAADSLDSRMPHSPLTPQLGTFPQFPPGDVKPLVSPAMSTATLPEETYQYGPGLFPGMTAPRIVSASADHNDSSAIGNGLYDSSNDGYLNTTDPTGLEGLGFGNGDGGGGDEHDQNGNGDQPPDLLVTHSRGKKLPLACHFCRRRKLKCDGIKPSCDNCNKRGLECTYDDHVRRRGPGKRTKEMRDRAAQETAEAGLINSVASAIGVGQQVDQQYQEIQDEHDKQHLEVDHSDLMLDPALADEIGGPRHDDVMEAMGALKQAGIELGLHQEDIDDLGEPSTLAELSGLSEHDHQQLQQLAGPVTHQDLQQLDHDHELQLQQELAGLDEPQDEESRKRNAEYELEEQTKRIKMSLTGEDELDLLDHVNVTAHELQ